MRMRCSRWCTRCARASLPAPASLASGFLAPSYSKTPWTGTSRGSPTADYLWNVKQVVPFLKVDKGLAAEKEWGRVDEADAQSCCIARQGQNERHLWNQDAVGDQTSQPPGLTQLVDQQFELGVTDYPAAGLVPIVEPEVDIHCPRKSQGRRTSQSRHQEETRQAASRPIWSCSSSRLPEQDDFYADFVRHPNVVRVVALSGGYAQEQANQRLRRNHGVVASFSRALVEGLSAQQSDAEFNALLAQSIQRIYDASIT